MKVETKVRNRKMDIRLCNDEYNLICKNALDKGYRSMAAYVRDMLTGRGAVVDKAIMETNKIVKKIEMKIYSAKDKKIED